jgi:hypothetical protein
VGDKTSSGEAGVKQTPMRRPAQDDGIARQSQKNGWLASTSLSQFAVSDHFNQTMPLPLQFSSCHKLDRIGLFESPLCFFK